MMLFNVADEFMNKDNQHPAKLLDFCYRINQTRASLPQWSLNLCRVHERACNEPNALVTLDKTWNDRILGTEWDKFVHKLL